MTRWIGWKTALDTMQAHPGEWRLLWRDAPVRRARNLTERAHPVLQGVEGILFARVMHSYKGEDGVRRGDIWGMYRELKPKGNDDSIPQEEGNEDVG